MDGALRVAEDEVLFLRSGGDIETRAGDSRRARAVDHKAAIFDLFAGHFERVDDRGQRNDRGAVLVVVEHRNIHPLLERLLDFKAGGRADVFEVDAAESRLEAFDRLDHLLRVGTALVVEHPVDAQRNRIDVGEPLEEHRLAFHHRQAGFRPDVAQPEHRGAVAHHRDEIAARGVFPYRFRFFLDFKTGLRDARRISQRQVFGRFARLRRVHADFARLAFAVVSQRLRSEFFFGHFQDSPLVICSEPECPVPSGTVWPPRS
ncbi:hypothetical protein SDC9_128427 [bioreactor metagenome]|uniref:Uncharacterized protein n=1 Tax=bioreactor metagenome TaxID=1076179 RepID=A0A645CWR8_9ZZZZ